MRSLLLVCFALLGTTLWAQSQYEPMNIPLTKNGQLLRNAWAGGMNLPQFSEVDLNNDGTQDLVTFDREGVIISTFINQGTPGQVDYHYAPEYMEYMPSEGVNFMLFRDYNCDGVKDIFGMYILWGQGYGVAVWEGSYVNDTITYVRVVDQIQYQDPGATAPYKLFIYNTDLPAVDDIDNDGDLDILSFTLDVCYPKNVFWYRNMSVENGHGCDSLQFELGSQCWGLFEETGDSSILNFGPNPDSCYNNSWYNQRLAMRPPNSIDDKSNQVARNARHIGANITAVDYNGDGVKDLALGGVTYNNVNMVSGVDSNGTILINSQDYQYPSYNVPADVYSFAAVFFLDVNNDNKTDMLVTPSEMGIGEATMDSVAWYYQNTNNNSNMIFNFQQKDFLVGEMLDVGHRAFPAVFDYNGDGLKDILVGGFGRAKQGIVYDYGMTLLENTGTATQPAFNYVTNDYAALDSLNRNGLHPTFGDLDGDGDMDLLCGNEEGDLIYCENTAGAGNTATWTAPVMNYMGIDVGTASSPFLVDLDRDTDLDLLVGNYAGFIEYFENQGSTNAPNFSSTPTITALGDFNIQNLGSRNAMPFVYDDSGSYQLFIGHQSGEIIHLNNIDSNLSGQFDTVSMKFKDFYQGRYTDFAVDDLDNDGKPDYILGTGRGGLMVMAQADTTVLTTIETTQVEQKLLQVYPNPAHDVVTLSFITPHEGDLNINIYNALGQRVLQTTKAGNASNYNLDIANIAAGVLFIEVQSENYREVVQFIKR